MFANVTSVVDPETSVSKQDFAYTSPEWACIRPVGTQFFYGDFNTEVGMTHTIFVRWRPDAMSYDFLVEHVILPDMEEMQKIQYEILRATDWNGFRFYTKMDCRVQERST